MAFLIDGAVGIITDLGKCVFKQIGHQLGYIVFYNRNKKELKAQIESLETTKKDVDLKVEVAKSKGYEILKEVSKWLADVDDEKKKHDELSNPNPPCFNFLQRHQLSRKAKKMTTDICGLKDRGNNFWEVGCFVPLPDTKNTIVPEGYQILESKILMAKQIKDALAKPEVKKVGIYGMGGVGKTYLLNEVKKLVLKGNDKLFDRAIDVVVGQSNDVMNVQQQIGDLLNNKELPKTKEGRASFLRNALEEMKGNILITFDDLWNEFDLIKDVGIPLSKEGCKILMTSRFQNILDNKMSIEECFEVTCLDNEESWKFFMKIIGDKFDTTDIENIAREVAEECGGLPLALNIIAKTLKGKDKNYWEGALTKLKNSIPVNIKDVGEKVYAPLKLSYEYLDGEEAKSLFLLCSVFPDDHEISVKDLQMYAMGMRLLKMVNTWKEARTETHNLVEDLTSSSLLQRLENKDVRMHDIVRDVAIYIGLEFNMSTLYYGYSTSSKGLDKDKCGSYRAIYCKKFWNLTPNMTFPKLDLLIFDSWERVFIVDAYFEGMGNLKVLDMRGTRFVKPFWTSLKNLRTLRMIYCWCNGIDTIGHLKKLEILRINDCAGITELPTCMCELKQLKVLDVSGCLELLVIRTNIISSMTKLEELDIPNSFYKWGEEVRYKNTWIQNAQLSELNCLSHLFILRVHVLKPTILSEALSSQILKNLREFFICVHQEQEFNFKYEFLSSFEKYEKNMYFNMKSQIGSVNMTKFNILLEGTEMLIIENDFKGFANDIFKAIGNGYPVLKCLVIIQNTETPHFRGNTFTSLEWLILHKMMILKSIVPRHASTNPFNKLEGILIESCKQLRNLFSLSIYKGLSNLREININECDMMDEIVSSIEIEDHTTIFSSPLTSLVLSGVNKLISFCSTKPSIQQTIVPFFDQRQVSFPQLEYLSIDKADNLEMLWHNNGSSFSKLQTIEIMNCNKLRCVFPSNIVTSLVSLDTLKIHSCELLEMVFEIEKRTTSSDTKVLPLRNLSLDNLPQLKYVWNKDVGDVLAFPILTNVDVAGCCPKLKSIFPVSYTKYMKKIKELKVEEQNEILPVLDGASKLKQVVLLQSLVDLQVRGCHSMINLFSASVAKNLVNLSSIAIYDCREMTSIVAAEAEQEKENGEIVFNKLTRMAFDNLARLECFYSGKCTMEFPILNELRIKRCDDMKIFSYGITNTPTLEYIKIGVHKLAVFPTQGINDIIHAFFALEKKKESEMYSED